MTPEFDRGTDGERPEGNVVSGHSTASVAARDQSHQPSFLTRAVVWVVALGLVAVALVGAFGAGIAFERQVLAGSQLPSDEPLTVFDTAWETVVENYVEEASIDEAKMLEGAIEGMLATLGDEGHTRYLTAEETELDRQSSRGVYQGVGIQVHDDEDVGLLITRVFPNSPASEEGVLPGDIVIAVDGEDIQDMPIDAIIALIRGPEGTRVDITVYRPSGDEEIIFELERREIEVSAVTWEMLDNNIALLKLTQFSDRAGEDLTRALDEAKQDGAEGIILDLRGNPGGLVREAMEVASLFVPDDAPVYISRTRDGGEEIHRAEGGDVFIDDLPIVVLVDGGTASASEIVSGSIQTEADNATIVGEQTVGTGTVLRRFELGDGSSIWLGIELWLTPEGRMIREQGITPDIIVPLAENQLPYDPIDLPGTENDVIDDDQLSFAIDLLLDGAAYYPDATQFQSPEVPW
ncbi:S41 family peptidase [soil metagenome]